MLFYFIFYIWLSTYLFSDDGAVGIGILFTEGNPRLTWHAAKPWRNPPLLQHNKIWISSAQTAEPLRETHSGRRGGGVAPTNPPVYQNNTRPWPLHVGRLVNPEPWVRCDQPACSSSAPAVSSPLQAAGGIEEGDPSGESHRVTQIRSLDAEQPSRLTMEMR